MKAKLFEELSKNEIIDNLEAENVGVEESYEFLKPFDDEKLQEIESEYLELSKQLEHKEQEKKRLLTPIQADLKGLKDATSILRKSLAQGGEVVNEKVFMFPDYENKMMGLYDSRCLLVGTRPMNRTERQLHINSLKHIKQA